MVYLIIVLITFVGYDMIDDIMDRQRGTQRRVG